MQQEILCEADFTLLLFYSLYKSIRFTSNKWLVLIGGQRAIMLTTFGTLLDILSY